MTGITLSVGQLRAMPRGIENCHHGMLLHARHTRRAIQRQDDEKAQTHAVRAAHLAAIVLRWLQERAA